jgi:hypothetical protein
MITVIPTYTQYLLKSNICKKRIILDKKYGILRFQHEDNLTSELFSNE